MEGDFCTLCGSKLEIKSEILKICHSCGQHHYLNPKPACAVILENEVGEVLMVLRKVDPKADYWDLPGGFVDINESLEKSCEREIKEELGIEIEDIKYFFSDKETYQYQQINYHVLNLVLTAKIKSGKLGNSGEIKDFKFFKKSEIPLDRIAFDSLKKALLEYCEIN